MKITNKFQFPRLTIIDFSMCSSYYTISCNIFFSNIAKSSVTHPIIIFTTILITCRFVIYILVPVNLSIVFNVPFLLLFTICTIYVPHCLLDSRSVVTQRSSLQGRKEGGTLRDDTENGCVADYIPDSLNYLNC